MSKLFPPPFALSTTNLADRKCIICNSGRTYVDKKGRKRWYRTNGGFLCNRCHSKITNRK